MSQEILSNDLLSEASVLGSVMIDPAALARIADYLRPTDFYSPNYGTVYRVALDLFAAGQPIDLVTVGSTLEGMGFLGQLGGWGALESMINSSPDSSNVVAYATLVKRAAKKRGTFDVAREILRRGEGGAEVEALIEFGSSAFFQLAADGHVRDFERVGIAHMDALMNRIEILQSGGGVSGLTSGFRDVDAKTTGYRNGEMTVLAARPGMGKTSFAINTATHLAVTRGIPVGYLSLEMSMDNLLERVMAQVAEVDSQKFRKGGFTEAELERIASSAGALGEAPLYIDDNPALDEVTMMNKARRMRQAGGIKLLILDYLQLMKGRGRNREQEVASAARAAREVARELEIPVLSLAQLSRETERRADRRPELSDLRESGEIEQTADVVAFLFRQSYYDKSANPNEAEFLIKKNRNGPLEDVRLHWNGSLTLFRDHSYRTP